MTTLVDFEWQDEPEEVEDAGLCFVAYARDSESDQWYRIAVALSELEDLAKRKAVSNEQRQH